MKVIPIPDVAEVLKGAFFPYHYACFSVSKSSLVFSFRADNSLCLFDDLRWLPDLDIEPGVRSQIPELGINKRSTMNVGTFSIAIKLWGDAVLIRGLRI